MCARKIGTDTHRQRQKGRQKGRQARRAERELVGCQTGQQACITWGLLPTPAYLSTCPATPAKQGAQWLATQCPWKLNSIPVIGSTVGEQVQRVCAP